MMKNDILKVLYTREELEAASVRLGQELKAEYDGKKPVLIGVLKGAMMFMADLLKETNFPVVIDFIDVSSYHGGTSTSGVVDLVSDVNTDLNGRDVILVEDILDTGVTLKYLVETIKQKGAKSVKICTLLDKREGRQVEIEADFIGYNVPNAFLVGYGLDYDELYRNLPYIGILKPEVYENN